MVKAGCNLWRNWSDIQDNWGSLSSIIDHWGDYSDTLMNNAAPGHWNDPDMLLIGAPNSPITVDEAKTQFAIWSTVAAPLIMGNDLRKVDPDYEAILKASEVIAVNQDPLGQPGGRISDKGAQEIWARHLHDGAIAVVMYNKEGGGANNCTWDETDGKYPEASGGGAGNLYCGGYSSLDGAKQ